MSKVTRRTRPNPALQADVSLFLKKGHRPMVTFDPGSTIDPGGHQALPAHLVQSRLWTGVSPQGN